MEIESSWLQGYVSSIDELGGTSRQVRAKMVEREQNMQ